MEPRTSSRSGTTRPRSARPAESAQEPGGELSTAESAVRASAQNTTQSTVAQSSGLVDNIKARAATQLGTQKDRASEGIGTLAQAVRHTTERLREEQHDTVAQYVDKAAEQLERWSNGLRGKDVSELLDETQRFARRRPALFVGGSFALGLLVARFLKSSRENSTGDYAGRPFDSAEMHTSSVRGGY